MNRVDAPRTTSEAILDAALELLGERGLRGTTTRAIAELAGVNEVTLFRKFGSKNNLVREAIASKFDAFADESVAFTGDIEADLIRLTTGYHAMLGEFGPVARSLLTEMPFDDDVAPALVALRGLVRKVSDLLGRYQEAGILDAEALSTMVPALLGPIVMPIVTGYALLPQTDPYEAFDAETHVRRFLYGRIADGGPGAAEH